MIPKILHRVVPSVVPDRFEAFWEIAQRLHPGWEFRTWQDPLEPRDFELGHKFGQCTSGAQLAGLVRLEVLWRYGGVYLDMDIEPLRPFDELLEVSGFVGTEDGTVLTDALMAAEPGHPGFRACIDRLLDTQMEAGALATGPHLVTSVLTGRDDVLVLPPRFFYPAKFGGLQEDHDRLVAEGESYAIHHWHRSWNGPRLLNLGESRREELAQHLERLRRTCRRSAKRTLVAAKDRWDRLTPLESRPLATGLNSERVLLTTSDGIPLLVPTKPGCVDVDMLATGNIKPGLRQIIERFTEPADSVLVADDQFGYHAVLAGRRVGQHGSVFLHWPSEHGDVIRDNLALHGLDKPAGPVVPVTDVGELEAVTCIARRSLPPALVLASSKESSIAFVRACLAGLLRANATALLIDVPDEPTGKSETGVDDLLRHIVSTWEAEIFICSTSGDLEPVSLPRVLVQRGFELVVLAPKTRLRT